MNRKRSIICIMVIICFQLLIYNSSAVSAGAYNGIQLCLKTVIPSLFPFFFLSNLLISELWGRESIILQKISLLFPLEPGAESLIIPAFLGGYPAGASTISNLYSDGTISQNRAESLLVFCNNSGPSFIFGMLAPFFTDSKIIWVIWFSHIIGAVAAGRIIASHYQSDIKIKSCNSSISGAMNKAIRSIATVCGWVVIFKIILTLIEPFLSDNLSPDLSALVVGLLELSNGCCMLPSITNPLRRAIIASALLSLGGLCIAMQTISVTGNLSLRKYWQGKAIQTIISVIVTSFFCRFPILIFPVMIFLYLIFWMKSRNSSSILRQAGI